MLNLSLLDWLFLITILCSIGIGAYRGWLPQALSMLGFVAAFDPVRPVRLLDRLFHIDLGGFHRFIQHRSRTADTHGGNKNAK